MDIKKLLDNYGDNKIKVSIARANDRMTEEMIELEKDMVALDIAIGGLKHEYAVIIDEHFIKGKSYNDIAKRKAYTKNAIVSRAKYAIKALEKIVL